MKKKIIYALVGILAFVAVGVGAFTAISKVSTIQSVIGNDAKIIYEEKVDEGSIVFYSVESDENLSACFVKDGKIGYKYVYGGGGELIPEESVGISMVDFPHVEGTPFPMYFGVVGVDEVEDVNLECTKNGVYEAKVVDWNDNKIWFTTTDGKALENVKVVGLDSSDEVFLELSK